MSCIQCGDCCWLWEDGKKKLKCPHLIYVRDKSFCDIYPYRPQICKDYPQKHNTILPNCYLNGGS